MTPKILALAALLLTSCANQEYRVFTPTEELWIDTYCHGDQIYRLDQERLARWVEEHRIVCPSRSGEVTIESEPSSPRTGASQ